MTRLRAVPDLPSCDECDEPSSDLVQCPDLDCTDMLCPDCREVLA